MNAHQNLRTTKLLVDDQPSSAVAALKSRAVSSLTTDDKRPRQISWPRIADVGLSDVQLEARADCIGGSDANVILSGAPELVLKLWREKRGEEAPEDLSSRLPVMLGSWTEAFNRQWYEKCTGQEVTRAGESLRCKTHSWRGCSLDGFVEAKGAVWEAKHTNGFGKGEDILARYMPQLQHNMAVAKAERALLSVIFGNHKWEVFEVAADWLYQDDLLEGERRFWDCVQSGEAPVAVAAPPAPKAVGVREICLQGNNAWAMAAADWLENREAAKKHAAAGASIKSLVEDDVARAFGHGIEARRSKAGALTIREFSA
jgi:predicted phage-related endonuclease